MQELLVLDDVKRKAVAWLAARLNPEGAIAPVEHSIQYYGVPWALAVGGRTIEAARNLDWVYRHLFDDEGDFTGPFRTGSVHEHSGYTCPNSHWLMAAVLLRRWDMVQRAADFLESLQDVDSGGAFNARGPKGDQVALDIGTTSHMGLALLAAGRIAAARKAGRFVADMWQAQPDPGKLYFRYQVGRGCVTDLSQVPEADRAAWVMDAQAERQLYFIPGVAAAFLGRLYQATGEEDWLDPAVEYQEFAMNATDKQFDVPQVARTGWGAAVLYQITGEAPFREWALLVGQYFRETQQPEGPWVHLEPLNQEPFSTNTTAEFIILLDTILACLSRAA